MPLRQGIQHLFLLVTRHQKVVFLVLAALSACYALYPFHDFQYYLAPGDHGRELYCYKKAMEGAVPYQEYSWLYGPLFLYYYGVFFHLFGITVQSVLLGQNMLIFGVCILIYLACSVFISPALSYLCVLWYLDYRGAEFFFSYHHVGGLVIILSALFSLFQYIRKSGLLWIYSGFGSILLLMLVRLNLGLAFFFAFVISLLIIDQVKLHGLALGASLFSRDSSISWSGIPPESHSSIPSRIWLSGCGVKKDRRWRLYAGLSFVTLAIPAVIYWALIHSLPRYAIDQTFPYTQSQLAVVKTSPWQALSLFFTILIDTFSASWCRKFLGVALIFVFLQFLVQLARKRMPRESLRERMLAFMTLFIFLIFGMHEFIGSGVAFRLNWVLPLLLIIIFYLFSELITLNTKKIFTPVVRVAFFLMFFYISFIQIYENNKHISSLKTPAGLLSAGGTRIYTQQSPDWIRGVTDAVVYIKANVPSNARVFCLPHDSLYNFLSGHDAPTRQLAFFEHTMIPPEQEKSVIADLEKNRVEWVVISNRIRSDEFGMGEFGVTHCRLLKGYLAAHFRIAAQFGDWRHPGGWAWDHGVRVLKRTSW